MFPQGHVLSKATIAKLVKFDKNQPKPMLLIIEEQ
jgi:hypothetical protein